MIWTDLPSNFKKKTAHSFTLERALEYLKALSGDQEMGARQYIENAPPEVNTPLRRRLREVSWLGSLRDGVNSVICCLGLIRGG